MNAETLRQYLEFYKDLGIDTVYRRRGRGPGAKGQGTDPEPVSALASSPSENQSPSDAQRSAPGPRPPAPGSSSESLLQILSDIGDCKRCRLHEGRNKLVFGVGDEHAPLVFVGEGPGADEDEQGVPFVGRAGQLLTQMIENTAQREGMPLKRGDVYICNVVKCRPPENRTPEPDEMEICGQFLERQLAAIHPKAICVLGGTAARALTGHREGVTKMRGKWFQWRDIPVMVTYHPSYLLRPYNQNAKREAWEDLKKVLHFVFD
ncbi:MAG: uracil-DNA glycosylase [Acidobacteriia bacterium]|nr:uracil-DNA glycosylase [Terriglobia bacterium]